MSDFRESTNVIDMRDAIPFLLVALPWLLGCAGACLVGYGWRERLGIILILTMFYLIVT